MTRFAVGGVLLSVFLSVVGSAEERMFAPVQYVAGDREWKCHDECLGTLMLGDGSLALTERKRKNPKLIFSVPIATVVKVNNRIDTNGPKPGAVIAFGVLGLASHRHDEYVTITTETETKTETFVLRVEKNASDGIIAKIDFAARKARAESSPK